MRRCRKMYGRGPEKPVNETWTSNYGVYQYLFLYLSNLLRFKGESSLQITVRTHLEAVVLLAKLQVHGKCIELAKYFLHKWSKIDLLHFFQQSKSHNSLPFTNQTALWGTYHFLPAVDLLDSQAASEISCLMAWLGWIREYHVTLQ